MKKLGGDFLKILILGLSFIVAWKIIDISAIWGYITSAVVILTPFIFGGIIAFFTFRPSKKMEEVLTAKFGKMKKGTARTLSVISVYLVLIALASVVLQFFIPAIYKNIQDFVANLPFYFQKLDKLLKDFEIVSNLNISQKLLDAANSYLNFDMMGRFVGVLGSVANSMLNFFLGIILSMYILIERDSLTDLFKTLAKFVFKDRKSTTLAIYTGKLVEIFNSYFVSLLLDAIIIGSVSAVFLYFFHAPYPWLLGLLVALGNMIPFFGPIVAAGVVYLVCAVVMGPLPALWALLFQIIAGQVDSNLIQPRLVGGSVGISPLWVIFAVTFFGGFWGAVGMILGVPIVASVRLLYLDYKEDGKLDGNLPDAALQKN